MQKLTTVLKFIVNISLGIIFILFASLQFNDPDPVLWILTYGFIAFLCFAFLHDAFSTNFRHLYFTATLLMLLGSIIQFPPQWDGFGTQMKTVNNELARESMGLLICAVVVGLQYLNLRRKFKKKSVALTL